MADPAWLLRGECVVAWAALTVPAVHLPPGVRPLPGPAAVVGARYDESPVGPYTEVSVAVPARLGLRPGLCTVAMVVTSPEARLACRSAWGLPTEVGAVEWSVLDEERLISWKERGLVLRARPRGPRVAAVLPLRSVQWRADEPVVASRRARGLMRRADAEVEVPDGDELAWLAGPHHGVVLSGARFVAWPARRPAGLLSSVPWVERAARPAPEPAGGAATMADPRAYGSVG